LLVDDEKVITEVAASMLTSLGYEVLIASNGEEAVSFTRNTKPASIWSSWTSSCPAWRRRGD
jgi:CheY-like chemotaxis protein